jgi:putative membrane protein
LPIAVGGIIAVLLFSKAMDRLIKTRHSRVYHFILGLVLASTILIVIPPVADYSNVNLFTIIVSAVLFAGGILLGMWMSRLEEKLK